MTTFTPHSIKTLISHLTFITIKTWCLNKEKKKTKQKLLRHKLKEIEIYKNNFRMNFFFPFVDLCTNSSNYPHIIEVLYRNNLKFLSSFQLMD